MDLNSDFSSKNRKMLHNDFHNEEMKDYRLISTGFVDFLSI